jgi:aconitate decarboxylase
VDGCMELKRAHGFAAGDAQAVTALVPPLVHQLVGRPAQDEMAPNYARLCAAFVAATALRKDFVGVEDFAPAALRDKETIALAKRFEVRIDGNPDRNALTPVTVELALKDGRRHAITLETIYGNPAKPMTREAHLQKFRRNCAAGARPLATGEALIAAVDELEQLADARRLVDLCVAA